MFVPCLYEFTLETMCSFITNNVSMAPSPKHCILKEGSSMSFIWCCPVLAYGAHRACGSRLFVVALDRRNFAPGNVNIYTILLICFIFLFLFSGPCVSYMLRKRALYNDMSR
jgi:hypothetical protein